MFNPRLIQQNPEGRLHSEVRLRPLIIRIPFSFPSVALPFGVNFAGIPDMEASIPNVRTLSVKSLELCAFTPQCPFFQEAARGSTREAAAATMTCLCSGLRLERLHTVPFFNNNKELGVHKHCFVAYCRLGTSSPHRNRVSRFLRCTAIAALSLTLTPARAVFTASVTGGSCCATEG